MTEEGFPHLLLKKLIYFKFFGPTVWHGRILILQPGTELAPRALEGRWSFYHWTTREVPSLLSKSQFHSFITKDFHWMVSQVVPLRVKA